jgi:predicted acylesterase/phospholipase RssA
MTATKKIGLALSGGGFRATLYHLGLIRFLRDADLLRQVTHITSVSGGSIFAAHLVLNWDKYTGSPEDFDRAAAQLIAFTRLDIRNRILRRFPLAMLWSWPRWLLGLSNRQLTRIGLLEGQYKRHLYGDKSLFELPEWPQLHILSTNLSEGCLCSFNRDGLWMLQEKSGRAHIERIRVGLMTVPMAVTASSAFPGFFPPLELTGVDVGARGGEFGRQAFTDGGVYDNLGVRMFRWLDPTFTSENKLDCVLVSDVGKAIEITGNPGGGLIRTALRASDILMDRVWQLESEIFEDGPGFVFARVIDVVGPHEDPTALHPEVQRQAANIRTDLDAFSPLEISCLIRHAYCLGRKVCRSRPDLFGRNLPSDPPWDPISPAGLPQKAPVEARVDGPDQVTSHATGQARELQASAWRRIWSTLLHPRDWTTYIYAPLLVAMFVVVPYLTYQSYQQSHRVNRLTASIMSGSPDFEMMIQLMNAPMSHFKGESPEELRIIEPPNYKGFTILQDSCIFDLRQWNPAEEGKTDATSLVYVYRRLKLVKNDNGVNDSFRTTPVATHVDSQFRFPPQRFPHKLWRMPAENPSEQETLCHFEVSVDLAKVPCGQVVNFSYEHFSQGLFLRRGEISSAISFRSEFDAVEMTRWILLPRGREYKSYQIVRYETGKPDAAEIVNGATEYLADDYSIIAYKMPLVKAGDTFEVTWLYK